MKKSKRWQMIWSFAKLYKITFATLFICIFATSIIGMLYPYIFGLLIDEVFYHKNMEFFKVIVISYCILYIGEQLLHLVLNYVSAYFATRFNFDIRRKLYEKILRLKAEYLNDIQTGDLINIINSDSEQIYEFIHWNVFYLIANVLRLIISIAFVGFINIKLMLLMMVVVPISVYVSNYFGKIVKNRVKLYRDTYGKYISWVFEILKGMREIQLFAVERHVTKFFVKQCSALVRLKIKTNLTEFASDSTNSFITLLSDLSVYILASLLILKGQLTVGAFIASIDYFSRASGLLKSLNSANMKIQSNMVSIDKVVDILSQEEEEEVIKAEVEVEKEEEEGKDSEAEAEVETKAGKYAKYENNTEKRDKPYRKKELTPVEGGITFSNINFKYNEHNEVLRDVNLVVKGGQRISLVGISGAGKSTIISMLLRFYEPETGSITIDGQDISKVSLKSLRKNIGVVQQENLLFQGTVGYNIKLGNLKAREEEVWQALEKANIMDFIKELPNGLDTVIGRGGVELSGGQRQRLTIARIFLKNPKILVFDEATSSLDYEAEEMIQKASKELSEGRTTIVIAHRLSTILDSDKVAVLKDGKIIAFDHHLVLLKECEYYRELFKEQYMLSQQEWSDGEVAAV
jgi:ATP-binding cassette, subfamily B, bacterial